jgi:hypothetical protein
MRYQNRKDMEHLDDEFPPPDTLDTLGTGLTVQVVQDALKSGEASANSCTANDPTSLAGILRWARTVRGLRDLLAKHGWRRGNVRGLPTVVSPDGKVAIAVSTGDEGTGTKSEAKTKYRKGKAAVAVVASNQMVFMWEGFDESNTDEAEAAPSDRVTWYLLFVKDGDEIRSEISLPSHIGTDGKVEGLTTRYLLPPLALNDMPPQPVNEEPGDVVEVSRR